MQIQQDDLSSGDVIELLQEHLADMYAHSPPESVHALDVEALKAPNITFYRCADNGLLLACAALKEHSPKLAELKSMRTTTAARNRGVASTLMIYLLEVCEARGYERLSLETGSMAFFEPARKLYEKFGFDYCEPFASYKPDPNSCFMSRTI